VRPSTANRFFQLINRRYTRSSTIVTSNKRVSEWAKLFGDEVLAAAILDRLLHDAEVLTINGPSWRLRGRGDIFEREPHDAQSGQNESTHKPRGADGEGLRRAHRPPTERPTSPIATERSQPDLRRSVRRRHPRAQSASHAAPDRHFSMAIDRHFSMALDTYDGQTLRVDLDGDGKVVSIEIT
jgi:hypothetical protein